jgi:hypothetical protein
MQDTLRIANELRARCNKLTAAERKEAYERGLALIYAGRQTGKTETTNAFIQKRLEDMKP